MAFLKKNKVSAPSTARKEVRKISVVPNILLIPLVSEKASRLQPQGQYTFVVQPGVSKIEVKKAIESAYNVRVVGVNSVHLPRKSIQRGRVRGTTRIRRHMIVRLAPGESLNVAATS